MRFGSVLRALLALTLLAAATACGDRSPDSEPAAQTTPAEALALARAADDAGKPEDRLRLLGEAAKDGGEPGRVATTWLLSLALEAHDPEAATLWLDRIVASFDGKGVHPSGRPVTAAILAGAVVDEAAAEARRRVEGPTPDPASAYRALGAGRRAADHATEDRRTIEAAAAYVGVSQEIEILDATGLKLMPTFGGIVFVFADHFQLGEPVLPSVLKRWSKGVDVYVVGLLVGRVREGIRRRPASETEEKAAIEARVRELGLHLLGVVREASPGLERLGLVTAGATAFVLDEQMKIVGRAAGSALDPRVLDPVVTRLAPKAAPEPDPTEKPGPR